MTIGRSVEGECLKLNVNRSKVMVLGGMGALVKKVSFDGRKLENVLDYKYSGLALDE